MIESRCPTVTNMATGNPYLIKFGLAEKITIRILISTE
jgi:hypothetical protein